MSQRRSKRRVQDVSDDDEIEERSPVRRRARNGTVNASQSQSPVKGKGRAIVPDSDDELVSDNDDDEEVVVQQAYRPELERGDDG
jgi:hypothetical protein